MARADDDDVVGPLRESIAAASIIVEGHAERSYTSWDGTDPTTIRTYTPFAVTRLLKGAGPTGRILLRQPGGEVAGASELVRGAEFSEGEQAIVFLGVRDTADSSYDVLGGRGGKFAVQRDDSGHGVLDVRLGADASAYGRAEKAPGTALARIPVELFEELAAGAKVESVTEFERQTRGAQPGRSSAPTEHMPLPTSSEPSTRRSNFSVLLPITVLVVLVALVWLMRRREP